jgi:hypothetical protein
MNCETFETLRIIGIIFLLCCLGGIIVYGIIKQRQDKDFDDYYY